MACRRKTKSERELVADIHKTFDKFCKKKECRNCPYKDVPYCVRAYINDLLNMYPEDEDIDNE